MIMKRSFVILALLLTPQVTCFLPVPILYGVGAIVSYIGVSKMFSSEPPQPAPWVDPCIDNECCTQRWIPRETHKLKEQFDRLLHGQNIAAATVISALRGFVNTNDPSKALTMSFNGLPGSGKNFVTTMIANSIYREGTRSKYYHFFNGRTYAPVLAQLESYKENLKNTIVKSLRDCKQSMFVFDEVDMMPVGLLNVLVPFIDYSRTTRVQIYDQYYVNVEVNGAIFIFLSNTGSKDILRQMVAFWEAGRERETLKLKDFENLIERGAFNEAGGFQKSATIRKSLIDYFVPFMPLERKHVELCMADAFRQQPRSEPTEEMENEVMESVSWGPEPHNIYAKSGCKKIEQKVIGVAYDSRHNEP